MIKLGFFLLLFPLFLLAAEPAKKSFSKSQKTTAVTVMPYLGPGTDKLSREDYERIYKNYIQTSILLGYPFLEKPPLPCDGALANIFRQIGLFTYPVPAEAEQVRKSTKILKGKKVETYEMAGLIVQVVREEKSGALLRAIWINSSSPRATRKLSQIVRTDILEIQKDPITGLERVKGVPVGYPHSLLSTEGQGLYVKSLDFNGKLDACEPVNFSDNTWVAGFDLSDSRCEELRMETTQVWNEKLSPSDFAARELKRLKDKARKNALAKGIKEEEVNKMIGREFVPPFTNEINIVGSAMRGLAQCNLLAIGRSAMPKNQDNSAPSAPANQGSGTSSTGAK